MIGLQLHSGQSCCIDSGCGAAFCCCCCCCACECGCSGTEHRQLQSGQRGMVGKWQVGVGQFQLGQAGHAGHVQSGHSLAAAGAESLSLGLASIAASACSADTARERADECCSPLLQAKRIRLPDSQISSVSASSATATKVDARGCCIRRKRSVARLQLQRADASLTAKNCRNGFLSDTQRAINNQFKPGTKAGSTILQGKHSRKIKYQPKCFTL